MKSFSSFLFLLLFLNINSVNAQNSLTKEQVEFVEIIKVILLDKEVNKFLEINGLFWNAEGKTIYILNEYTPFYVASEVGKPLQDYRETYKINLEYINYRKRSIFKTQEFNLHNQNKWRIIY